MAQVVYSNVRTNSNGEVAGSLFNGTKFWFSARVPMRKRFIDEVKANGGVIVPLEKQADMLIVDHKQKEVPANSFSYTYVDQSMRKGMLEDPENHRAAAAALPPRQVGSTATSAKTTRTPFTAEDDRVLLDWVNRDVNAGRAAGNAMYQELGEKNMRHPWQAWRDRYVKRYRYNLLAAAQVPANPPPTPPREVSEVLDVTDDSYTAGEASIMSKEEVELAIHGQRAVSGHREAAPPQRYPSDGPMKPILPCLNLVQASSEDDDTADVEHVTQNSASQHTDVSENSNFEVKTEVWTRIIRREQFEASQEATAANLLASTNTILEIPDDVSYIAWQAYARNHPENSWIEWSTYWKRTIQPFYEVHVEEFLELMGIETNGQSSAIISQLVKAESQSPAFQPDSPGLPADDDLRQADPAEVTTDTIGEVKSESPELQDYRSSAKRERDPVEDEWAVIPDTSPLNLYPARVNKRPRLEYALPESSSGEEVSSSASDNEEEVSYKQEPLYPFLPPDSDDEGQASNSKQRTLHSIASDEDDDDNDNENEQSGGIEEVDDNVEREESYHAGGSEEELENRVDEIESEGEGETELNGVEGEIDLDKGEEKAAMDEGEEEPQSEDGEEGEAEPEDEDARMMRLPSKPFSEPELDTQGKVDAQIFADLESHASASHYSDDKELPITRPAMALKHKPTVVHYPQVLLAQKERSVVENPSEMKILRRNGDVIQKQKDVRHTTHLWHGNPTKRREIAEDISVEDDQEEADEGDARHIYKDREGRENKDDEEEEVEDDVEEEDDGGGVEMNDDDEGEEEEAETAEFGEVPAAPRQRPYFRPSSEILKTQTQRRQNKRVFKPAAFRTEEEDDAARSSPELFVRSPTPPLCSSPPEQSLFSSPGPADSQPRPQRPESTTVRTPTSPPATAQSEPDRNSESSQDTDAALDVWIESHHARGVPYETVIKAMLSTSMDPVLADKVIERMRIRGKDTVPGYMAGVWTDADDECLESEDPRMLGAVTAKHGSESVEQRWKFLRNLPGRGGDEV